MDKKIAKEWCKALRSKKYKQGGGTLHDPEDNTYCCLGVLCELAKKKGVIEDYDGVCLPTVVRKWAGINSDYGNFYVNGESVTLADLNDGLNDVSKKIPLKNGKKVEIRRWRKAKFSTIANIIESCVDEL